MQAQYRRNYLGEYVVHLTTQTRGVVEQKREWIPNTINERHTGYAVVFGNGISRLESNTPFNLFRDHRGGLHATKKIATYGCNAFYRDHNPHFLIVNHPLIAKEIIESGYANNNIVLTNAKNILHYPDKFHLIPFNPNFCAGSTALYMAAFDGHEHVYFIGFDGHDTLGYNNNVYAGTNGYPAPTADVSSERWEAQAKEVFDAYPQVQFTRVMPRSGATIPEIWKYATNFNQVGWQQFVSEIDLGAT